MGSVYPSGFKEPAFDRQPGVDLQSVLDENARLKTLVVQLSDMILKRVAADAADGCVHTERCVRS